MLSSTATLWPLLSTTYCSRHDIAIPHSNYTDVSCEFTDNHRRLARGRVYRSSSVPARRGARIRTPRTRLARRGLQVPSVAALENQGAPVRIGPSLGRRLGRG